jgi:acyl-CoA reductase-like NAD-dependent aldehyde dehydrogenase
VVDPATERELGIYHEHGPEQIEAALAGAYAAYREWRGRPPSVRAALLTELAGGVRASA